MKDYSGLSMMFRLPLPMMSRGIREEDPAKMRTRKFALLLVVALALTLAATPSAATPTTFGQFVQASGGQMFTGLFNNVGNYNSVSASGQIYFFFLVPVPPALQGPQLANLSLSASSDTAATDTGGTTNQNGYTGIFTITLATPYGGHSNLLSGTFGSNDGGNLTGPSGGNSATLEDSVPPTGEVVFTSDFLTFNPEGVQAFSLSLSSVVQNLSRNSTTGYLNPFTAAGSGTFSADMATPEPAVLVLVGSGLLALGFLRRRKK